MALKIDAAVYCHIGHRANNEDNFYLNGVFMDRAQMNKGGRIRKLIADDTQLYAVCDGMGGAEYGEEASFLAVEALGQYQSSEPHPDNTAAINGMVAALSDKIDRFSLDRGLNSGDSGSTLAMLVFKDSYFRTVNVGDSRLYRMRNDQLTRLSRDDSLVQEMVDRGDITPEEAWQHPRKNVITKHLGMPTEGRPLTAAIGDRATIRPGDRFLLCSDGLSDALYDTAIAEIARDREASCDEIAERLAQTALAEMEGAGIASDNVTVMVLDVLETNRSDTDVRRARRWARRRALAGVAFLASMGGLIWSGIELARLLMHV